MSHVHFLKKSRKISRPAVTISTVMAETSHPRPPNVDAPADRPVARKIDWEAGLAEHDRWLRTAARARLGEQQAVDEVMQEVAVAALAQRAPLLDPAKVAPWLYLLTVRQVLQYRRRCGRQRKLVDRYARSCDEVDGEAASADPLDWLVQAERRHLVREALARLPRRDGEILLFKYSEGWSYRELAIHLGIGESAVEARLHRARRKLRDALARTHVIEIEVSEHD
jgi:RNA polymerase sigma-70 factor (ECF subfamily)